ncbi:MAG TPA: hypothetical protein VHM30_13855 [Gemmatimonadaceae bacterium]|nr:hypothetical protein [Gemmatimonadaceae bacterium]
MDYARGNFSIVQDPTARQSPPLVGQATFPAGFSGGSEPINLYVPIPEAKTLYVSWWMKLSPGFEGHPRSGVNKIFHIWIGGANRVTLSAQGAGTSALQPQVRLQRVAVPGGAVNLLPNAAPGATVVRGRWQHWELVLVANGDGNADGSVELWLDGVKVSDYCDQRFIAGTQDARWQSLNWAPTWGGTGASVRRPMYMWIDHIYISGL